MRPWQQEAGRWMATCWNLCDSGSQTTGQNLRTTARSRREIQIRRRRKGRAEWCELCSGSWAEFLFAPLLYAKFQGGHKLFFLANPKRATPAESIENDNEGNRSLLLTRKSRSFSHFSFRPRPTGDSARGQGPWLKSFFRKLVSYSNLVWLPHPGLLLAFALPLPLASGSLWRELLAGCQVRGVAVLGAGIPRSPCGMRAGIGSRASAWRADSGCQRKRWRG